MKRYLILISMAIAMLITACKKTNPVETQYLEGVYHWDSLITNVYTNGVLTGGRIADFSPNTEARFEFNRDGILKAKNDITNQPAYDYKYRYEAANKRIVVTEENGHIFYLQVRENKPPRLVLYFDETVKEGTDTRRTTNLYTCRKISQN